MNGAISVTVHIAERPLYVHGPVPATVTVANTSKAPLSVQLAYPVAEGFRAVSHNLAVATPTSPLVQLEAQAVPITLPVGASYTATYFLNRYFSFRGPGQAVIDWHLTVPFKQAENATSAPEFHGSFTVQLTVASEQELRAELARYTNSLQSSDRQKRLEAVEALAFLDTPLSAEYLIPTLAIEGLEVIGIHALGRNPSREYDDRIVAMLTHRESSVVGAALEEIDRHLIPVSRSEVQRLLSSENPNIQWLALGWLAARPSREDLPLLGPLLKSVNPPVRERARAYWNRLQ